MDKLWNRIYYRKDANDLLAMIRTWQEHDISNNSKFNNQFEYAFLINNLFNEEYTPHISRLRGVAGGVPNPGRSISINLS